MIDHEAIIKQQMLDQTIIEEIEYGTEYGALEELDPVLNPDVLASFTEERYDYGEEKIEIGRGQQSFKAIKLG
jgi:hypothetical protein